MVPISTAHRMSDQQNNIWECNTILLLQWSMTVKHKPLTDLVYSRLQKKTKNCKTSHWLLWKEVPLNVLSAAIAVQLFSSLASPSSLPWIGVNQIQLPPWRFSKRRAFSHSWLWRSASLEEFVFIFQPPPLSSIPSSPCLPLSLKFSLSVEQGEKLMCLLPLRVINISICEKQLRALIPSTHTHTHAKPSSPHWIIPFQIILSPFPPCSRYNQEYVEEMGGHIGTKANIFGNNWKTLREMFCFYGLLCFEM